MTASALVAICVSLICTASATLVGSQSATPTPSQWDGVFTDAQAGRGQPLYAQHCQRCHGADLTGLPQRMRAAGESLRTPPLVGDEFAANWHGRSLGDLFERIKISMPQENPGSLGSQQVAEILAYLLHEANYPSGASMLPSRRELMDGTKFLATRP
jgi:cytochrome c